MTFYPYGLCVALAAAAALLLAGLINRKRNAVPAGTLSWFALLATPLCFAFARAGFCLCILDQLMYMDPLACLRVTDGGFLLYGALLGGLIAVLAAARITNASPARLADLLAAPALLMISLCRLAEPLVSEGFGWSLEYWFTEGSGMSSFVLADAGFFKQFPFGVHVWDEWKWAVCNLEAVIALIVCAAVLRSKAAPGGRSLLMLLLYAAMQAMCESMRQDSVLRWGFVRCNQVLSAVAVAVVIAVVCIRLRKALPLVWLGVIACMGVVMAMEFALEKKILFLNWMPMDLCYLVMGLACIGMILCVAPAWRRAFRPALAQRA